MVAVAPAASTLAIPVFYQPMIDQQVIANISWGTPASKVIPTVVDTGSYGFWVAGPDAIVNSGSPYLGQMGSCNQTIDPAFHWPESSSHSGPYDEGKAVFLYGGGGKRIVCPTAVNDTMSFHNDYPPIENVQVASCDFIQIKSSSTTCRGAHYDKSIMGLAPIPAIQGGPLLHSELLKQGRLGSGVFSTWFDAQPADINEPQVGTLLFGAVPADKYTGDLVTLRNSGYERAETGYYYVGMPEVRAVHINGEGDGKKTTIPAANPDKLPQCLADSGTWGMTLPTDDKAFYAATGLEADRPFISPRYPAACADIPVDAAFELVFTGTDGKTASVKIPYRSLAEGEGQAPNTCRLNLQLGDNGCTLGGTFYASAFIAHDDEARTVQIAQGAVAGSAQGPPKGLRL
ncbi:hypothetical protein PG993_002275 [Apiospora rasikravindrae]|uniref:Peptidase A1 domain-containing protein n=1 Tax=Apiospora rasikravindrae TaxID=990691 RepID=A0ABR1TW60_9PEZI